MDIDDKVRGVYLTWSRIVRQTRQGNLAMATCRCM